MRRGRWIALAVAAVAVGLTACGAATRSEGPVVGGAGNTSAVLVVENQSTSDVRVYAVDGGQQVRLGNVTGLQTQRLEIPESLVGIGRELSFVADPLAGSSVASSFSIYVEPGDEVRITIPSTVR